ncbi:MAG: hypothetical protein NTZ33_06080 [Bacteroidetes bacterium]|nr:hypothetical protein [Bacteroidota bacterium]
MSIESLLFDSSRAAIEITMKTIEKNPELLEEAFKLCYEKYPVSMRAARVIQFYYEIHPEALISYLPAIVDELLKTNVDGVKRSFLKVLILTPDICSLDKSSMLFDKCLEWLMYNKETIAVRAYSIDLLIRFAVEEPELKHEINLALESMPFSVHKGLMNKLKKGISKLGNKC